MKIISDLDLPKDSIFACILNENEEKIECKFGRVIPELEGYTQTVNGKKNAKKVKVAITRKIFIAVWHRLSEGKVYAGGWLKILISPVTFSTPNM